MRRNGSNRDDREITLPVVVDDGIETISKSDDDNRSTTTTTATAVAVAVTPPFDDGYRQRCYKMIEKGGRRCC